MGRGRQKAKATRQARKIKYYSPETDYSALERELASSKGREGSTQAQAEGHDDYSDYEDVYADRYTEES